MFSQRRGNRLREVGNLPKSQHAQGDSAMGSLCHLHDTDHEREIYFSCHLVLGRNCLRWIYFFRVWKNVQGSSGDLFGVDDAFTGVTYHLWDSHTVIYNSSNTGYEVATRMILWLRVTITWGIILKGCDIRKVKNHWFREYSHIINQSHLKIKGFEREAGNTFLKEQKNVWFYL